MTRDAFDKYVLLVEQETGVTADKGEIEYLWSILKTQHPFFAKIAIRLGVMSWKNDKEKCEQLQRHYDN